VRSCWRTEAHASPGGKGANFVRAAVALGHGPTSSPSCPRPDRRRGGRLARRRGCRAVRGAGPGELRSAAIMLEADGRIAVLNEPGPPVSRGDWRDYADVVRLRLEGHRVLIGSGRTTPGSPEDAYARLVRIAAEYDTVAIADATPGTLAQALAAAPDVMTPNPGRGRGAAHRHRSPRGRRHSGDHPEAGCGGGRRARQARRARSDRDRRRLRTRTGRAARRALARGPSGKHEKPDRGGRCAGRRARIGARTRRAPRGGGPGRNGGGERERGAAAPRPARPCASGRAQTVASPGPR
jgi:hypothetical protein